MFIGYAKINFGMMVSKKSSYRFLTTIFEQSLKYGIFLGHYNISIHTMHLALLFIAIIKQNVKLNNCFETVKSQVFFVSPPAKYLIYCICYLVFSTKVNSRTKCANL